MKPHLVSVITPSYNQAEYIEECLLSVNNQDYPEIEHIVVDGGSEDGTINLLRGYEGRYNLNWVSEPDKGQSEAVNKGFLKAEGEIVGWINSDDVYLQSAVSSAVAHFSSQPDSKWVYGDAYWINQDGKVVNIYKSDNFSLKDLLLRGMYIPQPTIFFRKQVLEEAGLLDIDIHTAMDYDFCLRLAKKFKGEYIPKVLAARRIHPQSKSVRMSTAFVNDTIKALDKLYSSNNLDKEILKIKSEAYSQRYLVGGYRAFSAGDYRESRYLLWEALKLDPRPWRKEPYIILLLIFESLKTINWIMPGYSRRRSERFYQMRHKDVYINWKE